MAGVGPLVLAGAVRAVALILEEAPVEVIGLDGRNTYLHESDRAVITVSVHLNRAQDIDHVGDLLDLGQDPHLSASGLYARSGDWRPDVYVSLYGPSHQVAGMVGVAS